MKQYEQEIEQLPQIQAMKNVWQNDFHEFDVYEHTLEFVKHIKTMTNDDNIIAAGYLHDVGKPVTAKPKLKNGVWLERSPNQKYYTFDNHEAIGEKLVIQMDSTLFDKYNLNQKRIARLVGIHYEPMKGIKKMRQANSFSEFRQAFLELETIIENTNIPKEDVWIMFLADKLAQGKYCTDQNELFGIRDIALQDGDKTTLLQKMYKLQIEDYRGKK